MKKQQYSNHRRYYPPHHFVLLPLLAILLGIGAYNSFTGNENKLVWLLFTICIFLILSISVMLRQHYALGNQNRIVLLEFRLRYFELFGKSADIVVKQLSFEQVAALRFANEKEFVTLLNRALQDNISGDEIKRAITDWQADDNRV